MFLRSICVFLLSCLFSYAQAQNVLGRTVDLNVHNQPLSHVLEILSNKGNFYFSYNSNIIKRDSLVTLSVYNRTVQQILDVLFNEGYEYKESGNYIILRRTPVRLALVTRQSATDDNQYIVTGYILDDQTGESVSNASIYEKNQLVSAISDAEGYFKLRLKNKYRTAAISVSKQYYEDTTVIIEPKYHQQLSIPIIPLDITDKTITISPYNFEAPDSIVVAVRGPDSTHWLYTYRKVDSAVVEKTAFGKWLVSTWQKVQSVNLKKFFTVRPYQMSLLPGVSTNGRLNSQVINNFSFNIIGSYSGGVDGLEIGGLFNIDKKDVQYAQIAGALNIVGGSMTGAQIAGFSNTVLDSVDGIQVGGAGNFVKRNLTGWQLGGAYNYVGGNAHAVQLSGFKNFVRRDFVGWQGTGFYNSVWGSINGLQSAGAINFAKGNVSGAQIAGFVNINTRSIQGAQLAGFVNVNGKDAKGLQLGYAVNVNGGQMHGAQIAALVNYTKRLKGVQIGLLNIADTSDGYSIGLVNIILKGYHKLSLYSTEVIPFNAAFKTGNSKLYSILLTGISAGYKNDSLDKLYSVGYGMGREFTFNKRWGMTTELTTQFLYLGDWDRANQLTRLSVQGLWKWGKHFSVFAGPAFSIYYTDQKEAIKGYKFNIHQNKPMVRFNDHVTGWLGFQAGINLF